MDATLMANALALDASPATILRSLRGAIVDARIAHPDVLHLEIRDPGGGTWLLATQDAEWFPANPGKLIGNAIESAEIDGQTGALSCKLSDGSLLDVRPNASAGLESDPPNWELITPDDLALEFGPGVRWQISNADAPTSHR